MHLLLHVSRRRLFSLLCALATLPATAQNPSDEWFPIDLQSAGGEDVIGMADWLDAPAGRHGFVRQQGDRFVCEDGTPIKFWGVNIGDQRWSVPTDEVDRWADYLARYGVNGVRFHKFTWKLPPEGSDSSTALDPVKMARFDYFHAALKERGIYSGWSHIYGHRVRPADRDRLLAYDEIAATGRGHLWGTSYGLVNYFRDLQALNIELTVRLLNHRNPHTGLRYADDPALNFVELQNEDNAFFAAADIRLRQTPTYRRALSRMFSDWLLKQYGSEDAWRTAWGDVPDTLSPAAGNVYPRPNHGYFQWEYQHALDEGQPMPRHTLDQMRFLYEVQNDFYERFTAAVRATGYRGVIVTSGWQAGAGPSHYYNLASDAAHGVVDRHNYFGGAGHDLKPTDEPFGNEAMVRAPGSGLLSTGLQQVAGKPFMISEWISKLPNEWTAEAAPLIALYGMGLQGWDGSYAFANNQARLTETVEVANHGVYNADAPTHMGLYPTLARMIYRGDLREGEVISTRAVHVPSLAEGRLGFRDEVHQQRDYKSFGGDVPAAALTVGRVVVDFTDTFQPTEPFRPEAHAKTGARVDTLVATTEQLRWAYDSTARHGVVTVNSTGTQGVI
ncbi:MAG: hypothetical protein WBA12_10195, partial [Catalinimonas sp.]